LQLLQATQNIEKSDKPFVSWLEQTYLTQTERESCLMQNHIAPNQSLEFSDFISFIEIRRKTLKNQLMTMLDVKTTSAEPELVEA
jgi:hypothetical protein